ncbi:MAG: TauD/TfdA family dioxygenase [Alphaproteobacteria bacterium HGW-Alphaproteobacteria-3]|nr:MAG: TauD/TfdA family dioxygenase [Alphaproteobacteria bacterium HGW-Alphaproteobacteria-3]
MSQTATRPSHIHVTPNESGFGAEITGLDLSQPLPPDVLAEVKQAWADHAVVWFPDQPLTHDQLEAFTLQIGPFGHDPFIAPMEDRPHILELRRAPDEKARNFGAGWHSDWSFQDAPPAATLLHSKVVPPVGGDTLYADCARAYDALSGTMKNLLDGLVAIHSAALPYGTKGVFAQETEARTMKIIVSEEAESPVYTAGIEGMTQAESAAILGFLYNHMTRDEFVYRHKWRANMLTMWDNRCTLHFADGGYDGHLRVMHRTTVAGDAPH